MNTVGGDRQTFVDKDHVKTSCKIRSEKEHIDHVNTLVKQGDMLNCLKVKKVMQSGNPLSLT